MARNLQQTALGLGTEALHYGRQELAPNPDPVVALVAVGRVAVQHRGVQIHLSEPALELLPPQGEQRAHQPARAAFRNPREPRDARTAQQPVQHGLHLIVCVVRSGQVACAGAPLQLAQRIVARFARPGLRRTRSQLQSGEVKLQPVALGELLHSARYGTRLGEDAVVHVRHRKVEPELRRDVHEQVQHRH